MSDTSAATADTLGWDLVYAIKYADVNRSILMDWKDPTAKLPRQFKQQGQFEDQPASISGTFNPWRIVTGGGGSNIKFALPIASVTVSADLIHKQQVWQNLTAVVEVTLGFVPADLAPVAPVPGEKPFNPKLRRHLRMNTTTPAAPDAVSDPEITSDEGVKLDDILKTTLETLLKDWLDENLIAFTHVFHTVDMPEKLAEANDPSLAWLAPTAMGYAVAEPGAINNIPTATDTNSVFAILVMTENRINLNPVYEVSPFAIPAGADAALLVSKERFLTRFLLGGVHTLFKSATPADFLVTLDGGTITNTTDQGFDDMTLQDKDGNDVKTVSPDIKARNFTVTLKDSSLFIELINFHYQYSPGIDVYTNYTTDAEVSVDEYGVMHLAVTKNGMTEGMVTTSGAILAEEIWGPIVLSMALGMAGGALCGLADAARALKAGAQVAEAGADLAVGGAELAAQGAAEAGEAVGGAEQGLMEEAAADVTATIAKAGSAAGRAVRAIGGFLSRNAYKILGSMLGAGIGATIALIPKFLQAAANNDAQKTPSLGPFLDAVATNMMWPHSAKEQARVVSAKFNGCLQIGVDPGFKF